MRAGLRLRLVQPLYPSSASPVSSVRPTRAEVSLDRLRLNYHALRALVSATVWPVVKADAYGHGAKAVARSLERAGCEGLCVALFEEAVELRQAGVTVPLLVMGGNLDGAWDSLLELEITPVLTRADQVRCLAAAVRQRGGAPVVVHLKLDTGMARLGVPPAGLAELADTFRSERGSVCLAGVMTHFASADTDPGSVREQLACFARGREVLREHGLKPRVIHAANTAATLRHPEAHFDLVRPGVGVYGLGLGHPTARELQPVMRVRSAVVELRRVPSGGAVGYQGTFRASRPTTIATVPMGYADGLMRSLSNRAQALVRGRRVPIVGAISMDMCMLDVTDAPGVERTDEVVLLGEQRGPLGQDAIRAEELATHAGTIAWEVLTLISRRVPRFYFD